MLETASGLSLTLSDEEWMQEWNGIVALASPVPRRTDDSSSDSTDQIYESLEAIHVFALAHVLKRPIIVVSDTVLRNAKGEELSPVSFGGIYLPLECPSEQCHRSPLVLCYDSAHFSPLVPMRHDSSQMRK
ncbi:OTU-like cysteine protease [Ancylostoma caninum]|uniref:ubiquitinyl hydrolase 1 n=1 Tax=Ancylostoma caninum TaxID=29170 RepID=A0A368F2I8_ANCCA|nr:OTU-like cysteine protease [Ancylostoma caninum]